MKLTKGVMFGKLSQLDYFKLKSGAMFGLDARIALAIFGALSVISGAALYSAIQNAKVTAFITDLEEISKAFEAYYLDVGPSLAMIDSINHESVELIKSTKLGWKGPYLSYPIDTRPTDPRYLNKWLRYSKVGDSALYFSSSTNSNFIPDSIGTCSGNDNCSIYISLFAQDGADAKELENYFLSLDEKIDGGDGILTGDIRGLYVSGRGRYMYYRIMDKRNWK